MGLFAKKTGDPFEAMVREAAQALSVEVLGYNGRSPGAFVELGSSGKRSRAELDQLRPYVDSQPPEEKLAAVITWLETRIPPAANDPSAPSLESVRANVLPRLVAPYGKPVFGPLRPLSISMNDDIMRLEFYIAGAEGLLPVRRSYPALWGVSPEQVFELAIQNLRGRTHPSYLRPVPDTQGVQTYVADDGFEATRVIFVPDFFDPMPPYGVLVSIPTQHFLNVVPFREPADLEAIRRLAWVNRRAFADGPDPLYDQLLWTNGKRWDPFLVNFAPDGTSSMEAPASFWLNLGIDPKRAVPDLAALPPVEGLRCMSCGAVGAGDASVCPNCGRPLRFDPGSLQGPL